MRYYLIFFLFLLCTSCHRGAHLWVRTEYFDSNYMAANKVDSLYLCPPYFCGQQIVMRYRALEGVGSLTLHVRLANHEIVTLSTPVRGPWGYWVWRLANEEFCQKGPISGYKVELYQGECLIDTFCHLWVDPVFN